MALTSARYGRRVLIALDHFEQLLPAAAQLAKLLATLYAQWLAAVSGSRYRLPTEAEWEKAARGTVARIYPWGDEPVEITARVAQNRGPQAIAPIGIYPAGVSPYGAHDMAGNVLEWTSTLPHQKPYPWYGSNSICFAPCLMWCQGRRSRRGATEGP
jgi:formylglycine-generating enzyme required for sulfatase activity